MKPRYLLLSALASCATGSAATPVNYEASDGGAAAVDAGMGIEAGVDAGPDAAVFDACKMHPNDLCGTPRDAPEGTACGWDGLGYVWMHGCWYSCRFKDKSCAPPVLSEYCEQMCTDPKYLPFQSCVP